MTAVETSNVGADMPSVVET